MRDCGVMVDRLLEIETDLDGFWEVKEIHTEFDCLSLQLDRLN